MNPANEAKQYLQTVLGAFGPDEGVQLDQDTWARIHKSIAALASPGPDSVLVPREPTGEMLAEAYALFDLTPVRASEIYKAMLSAAPPANDKGEQHEQREG